MLGGAFGAMSLFVLAWERVTMVVDVDVHGGDSEVRCIGGLERELKADIEKTSEGSRRRATRTTKARD